ncbi:MAG: DNA-binding response regulator [Bacteroidetes bacterium]|jgi:DNA-binding LytR/AlgR family response regulator|nr:DNA-binding response regulator [Bacteroidota bacterium]
MIIENNPTQTKTLQTRFLVYVRDYLKSIEVHEIAYFYFEDKVTYVVTHKNEKYMLHRTLNQLEEKLDEKDFFRINRMFLVSYQSIGKIEPYLGNRLIVFLKPDMQVKAIVSREKVSEFKNWLNH